MTRATKTNKSNSDYKIGTKLYPHTRIRQAELSDHVSGKTTPTDVPHTAVLTVNASITLNGKTQGYWLRILKNGLKGTTGKWMYVKAQDMAQLFIR